MESSSLTSDKTGIDGQLNQEGSDGLSSHAFELDSPSDDLDHGDSDFGSMSALDILRETVRILRFNSNAFMGIAALLICPVSGVLMSNVLVNRSLVKMLAGRLLLVARTSGLPLSPYMKQSAEHLVEIASSLTMCFPLFVTLLLLSKAAVVYAVDCTYARKEFDVSKFYGTLRKIWRQLVFTYLLICMVVVGCITLFLVVLLVACSLLSSVGLSGDLNLYAAFGIAMVFAVLYANAIVICNVAVVITVLEDVSGLQTLVRSYKLIKEQNHVGLVIFLGSTIGMAFLNGLFEHRVKTISYGDGSSRIWEGPLLVMMYSFVVLVDSMMSAVFYFNCRSCHSETSNRESHPILESTTEAAESEGL